MVELEPLAGDPLTLRRVYGCFPSGVTAVCALDGAEPVGIAASSFTSVSMDPALVSVCVQNTSTTWPRLRRMRHLGVSVLAEDHGDACLKLSLKTGNRFADVGWADTGSGAVLIHGAVAWLDCTIHREVPAGDHAIVLLAVHAVATEPERAPLIFHGSRFRQLAAS